jgi:hypothetical protein
MKTTRKTDSKGRVTLYPDFGNHLVIVERIGEDEVRIRKATAVPKRKAARELIDAINEDNLHSEIDFGPPVGKEIL